MAQIPPLKLQSCPVTGEPVSIDDAIYTLPIALFYAAAHDNIARDDIAVYLQMLLGDPTYKNYFTNPFPKGTTLAEARSKSWPSAVRPLSRVGAARIANEYFKHFGRGSAVEASLIATGDAMTKFPTFHPNPIPGRGRTVGLEIESNPTPETSMHVICNWLAAPTVDHSIRGTYAIEFRSPVLRESTFPQWTNTIFDPQHWESKIYSRCGQHLWVGVDDFSWFDLAQFIKYCWIYRHYFYSIS